MDLAVVGIGFEDNTAATVILGAIVMVVAFALLYWRLKRAKR
ncbi:LPXTG cell wall anchor domain-containing protein [Streptomyces youssoufiensis]